MELTSVSKERLQTTLVRWVEFTLPTNNEEYEEIIRKLDSAVSDKLSICIKVYMYSFKSANAFKLIIFVLNLPHLCWSFYYCFKGEPL
jgi:hypothetical protein